MSSTVLLPLQAACYVRRPTQLTSLQPLVQLGCAVPSPVPSKCRSLHKRSRKVQAAHTHATNSLGLEVSQVQAQLDCRPSLKNFTFLQLEDWCIANGERPQRAVQLWRWLYADHHWLRSIDDAADVQNGFSQGFRESFHRTAVLDSGLALQSTHTAADGTRKLVFALTRGAASGSTVETVLIPVVREGGSKARLTLCVSSQVGCAMNCQFCYTGRMGLSGDLSTAQVVEQVVEARRLLAAESPGDRLAAARITNIVFMGMGEPLANLAAVLPAVDILTHPLGLHFSHNKITVSTVGLVPAIHQFVGSCRAQLAVSLHATTDEVRDWIAPVNRRWNLAALTGALRHHFPRGPAAGRARRDVLIEYVMLRGVNDTLDDAHRFLELFEDIECKLNLIVFNPHEGTRFQPSEMHQVLAFRDVIIQGGRVCTIRDSRGDDEMAACGQLGDATLAQTPGPILQPPERFREYAVA